MNEKMTFFDEPTPWERQSFILHMAIALFCIPFYLVIPALSGLVISPYLVYLILKPRSVYLLPLIVHTFYGSQQQYLMLAACFLYCLVNVNRIRGKGLLGIYLVYLMGIPFFAWYTVERYRLFGGGIGHGGTFEGLCYYFAFVPFFWGAIAIKKLDKQCFYGLIVLSLWFVVSSFVGLGRGGGGDGEASLVGTFSRFSSWGGPFVVSVFVWSLLTHGRLSIKLVCGFGALLFGLGFLHVGRALIPFHLMGTAMFAVMWIVLNKWCPRLLKVVHPWACLAVVTLMVFIAIGKFENREIDRARYGSYEDNNTVRDIDSLRARIFIKLYGDRAPVWTASLNAVERQLSRSWFFVDVFAPAGELMRDDGRSVVIEMQAHNLLLELLRLYGLYGGGVCLLVFYLIAGKRQVYDVRKMADTPLMPILACAMGHFIFGYWGGQYLATKNFSFTIFGLVGVCYSLNRQGISLQRMFRR